MSRFLIIGATGQQGGSVVDALEGRGHQVVAFVRDPQSDKARVLVDRGVELAVGSLDDQATIEAAFTGADAAFAVTSPFTTSLEVEVEQGRRIADAAKTVGLPFLVLSSVASADRSTGIGHFDSKNEEEKYVAELGIPAAVIAPVFFMENYLFPWNTAEIAAGKVREAFAASTKLQMVSSVDIGKSAAAVMEQPQKFKGQRIELVGDELSGDEIASVLGSAVGREVVFERQPIEEVSAFGPDMVAMYEWLASTGYSADPTVLARELPQVSYATFAEWTAAQDWAAVLGATSAA